MMAKKNQNPKKRLFNTILIEAVILLLLIGAYRWYVTMKADDALPNTEVENQQAAKDSEMIKTSQAKGAESSEDENNKENTDKLTPEEREALELQARLNKEIKEREDIVARADRLALGYQYEDAIKLLKGYTGSEGDYTRYPVLTEAIERLEKQQSELVLYGGTYDSITQINHIFFHSLVADPKKAFDGDSRAKGYNMYMATIKEFNKIIEKLYEDGYVLVNMSDLTEKVNKDGSESYQEAKIYLRNGKKPMVLSIDDVSYYAYMDGDGFAKRIIIDENGKSSCEMVADGSIITGAYDIVPLLDEFVEEHPDFSYRGAKGLIALTGYEGILGYRTNDTKSPTYEEDRKTAKKVAEALKAEGWEFGSHSWGHKNMQTESVELLKRDTDRWLEEVEPLIGKTDVYVFPFGADMEQTVGPYTGDKYHYLRKKGFHLFLNVYSKPWMQIRKDYVRMGRRPIDGQAMLQFPERLKDLFNPKDILDPDRPPRNW
jgi:peptidoglycan/xylan/chitin deacetylase (PgdA/CDA1 family)